MLNTKLFDSINNEQSAYFLGLLFADGNVHSKYNSITLKLHERDVDILEKLQPIIGVDRLYRSGSNLSIKFSDKNIKDKLIDLGCIPNKSLKIVFPNIDESLRHHFIRGYFDGDGSIFSNAFDYQVAIISTESFCKSINEIIIDQLGIAGRISKEAAMLVRGNDITAKLSFGGNRRILKIMEWLYRDATLYMERKYAKFMLLKSRCDDVDAKRRCNRAA